MAGLLSTTPFTKTRGSGSTVDVTIPATTAGQLIVVYMGGGAISQSLNLTNGSGPSGTRRTPAYSGGSADTSIWDVTAAGGETVVHLGFNGDDNISGAVYQFGPGLTFVDGSNNGSGGTADQSTDFQIRPTSGVTATAASTIVGGFLASTTTAYGIGNRWRGFGPTGAIRAEGGNQPGGSGVNFVWATGAADVDQNHSWPEQNLAGTYEATSDWLGAGSCWAVQALYADASGVPTNPAVNDIVRENRKPGTDKGHWFLNLGTNPGICGYTNKQSYQPGDTVQFFVDSASAAFRIEIYRLGFYNFESFSARNVLGCQGGYIVGTPTVQPAPAVNSTLGSPFCSWSANGSWTIPDDMASGQFYVLLRRTDDTTKVWAADFIVSGNDPTGKVAVCLPDFTRVAYNIWGAAGDSGVRGVGTWSGVSLYQKGSDGALPDITHRAYAADFRRPNGISDSQSSTYLTDSELGTIAFLEAQGYDLCYVSNFDMDADPHLLDSSKAVFVLGHHEYLTTNAYDCLINARNSGVNILSQGANNAGWRVRFDSSDTQRRTMICYKESESQDQGYNTSLPGNGYDPGDTNGSAQYTGAWRDTRQVPGGVDNTDIRSDDSYFGQLFIASGPVQTTLSIPASAKSFPLWRNSIDIQGLATGASYTTKVNAQGYECDYPSGGPFQPANLVNVGPYSASFVAGANAAGSTYDAHIGPITLGFTLYRADSGALVFHTGVWRGWWGVSRWQGGGFTGNVIDVNWQNALLAVMYDLGLDPATLTSMQPGIDTEPTDPATGAPGLGNASVARAYGLKVPSASAILFFLS